MGYLLTIPTDKYRAAIRQTGTGRLQRIASDIRRAGKFSATRVIKDIS
jgi:hypothetical protein